MPVLCQQYLVFSGLSLSSQPRLRLHSTQDKHGGPQPPCFVLCAEQCEPRLTIRYHRNLAETFYLFADYWSFLGPFWGREWFGNDPEPCGSAQSEYAPMSSHMDPFGTKLHNFAKISSRISRQKNTEMFPNLPISLSSHSYFLASVGIKISKSLHVRAQYKPNVRKR